MCCVYSVMYTHLVFHTTFRGELLKLPFTSTLTLLQPVNIWSSMRSCCKEGAIKVCSGLKRQCKKIDLALLVSSVSSKSSIYSSQVCYFCNYKVM